MQLKCPLDTLDWIKCTQVFYKKTSKGTFHGEKPEWCRLSLMWMLTLKHAATHHCITQGGQEAAPVPNSVDFLPHGACCEVTEKAGRLPCRAGTVIRSDSAPSIPPPPPSSPARSPSSFCSRLPAPDQCPKHATCNNICLIELEVTALLRKNL